MVILIELLVYSCSIKVDLHIYLDNELLMHQRSKLKIAFPLAWTNSCCSHPGTVKIYKMNE
jgi:isopentenyldiphosphate isomerase